MTDIAPEGTLHVDFNSRSIAFKNDLNLDMMCVGFDVNSINHHVYFFMYILTWYDVSKLIKTSENSSHTLIQE
jgi:hypothetical protein